MLPISRHFLPVEQPEPFCCTTGLKNGSRFPFMAHFLSSCFGLGASAALSGSGAGALAAGAAGFCAGAAFACLVSARAAALADLVSFAAATFESTVAGFAGAAFG